MDSLNHFSHLDEHGQARMVDVGDKPNQTRIARAVGRITCQPTTLARLREQALPKGDVLAVARVAGILAAKKTDDLIPLCHSLPIEQVTIDFSLGDDFVEIEATTRTTGKTGVEMEALTAVSVAALTLYDMMKAVDKSMVIGDIRVTEKSKR